MDITKIIMEHLSREASFEKRNYLGASLIGKECPRAIWYMFHGFIGSKSKPELKITLDVGKRLESLLLDYLEAAGLNITRPCEENNFLHTKDPDFPVFQGHMDALLNISDEHPIVLEIKTAKNSQFQRFKEKGLLNWSKSYYAQAQSYMGMTGYTKAVLIALNKDSSELHHEWINFDEIFYYELRTKAMAIASIDEPPERINSSPLFYLCAYCQFKNTCFKGEK